MLRVSPLGRQRGPHLDINAPEKKAPTSPRLILVVAVALVLALLLFLSAFPLVAHDDWDREVAEVLDRIQSRARAAPKALRIPMQLVLTAKQESLAQMPKSVQANVRHTLRLSPGVRIRWLGDVACLKYLSDHFDHELVEIFKSETRGSFRGDICRAAVLAREGGFYLDLDVELRVPLEQLVDHNTTFVSAFTEDQAILNAVLAASPGSAVMREVLTQIRLWYSYGLPHQDEETTSEFMGPVTMLRALRTVTQKECQRSRLFSKELQWPCGPNVVRLYYEHGLSCGWPGTEEECPPSRAESTFDGVRYGIFTPEGELVAWPRFASCDDWGCNAGGWVQGPMDQGRANATELPTSNEDSPDKILDLEEGR